MAIHARKFNEDMRTILSRACWIRGVDLPSEPVGRILGVVTPKFRRFHEPPLRRNDIGASVLRDGTRFSSDPRADDKLQL